MRMGGVDSCNRPTAHVPACSRRHYSTPELRLDALQAVCLIHNYRIPCEVLEHSEVVPQSLIACQKDIKPVHLSLAVTSALVYFVVHKDLHVVILLLNSQWTLAHIAPLTPEKPVS